MRVLGFLPIAFAASGMAYCPAPGPMLPRPSIREPPKRMINDSAFEDLPFNKDTSYIIKAELGGTELFTHSWIAPQQYIPDKAVNPENLQTRIASVTKLFTVLAVLLSEDKLSWEAGIREYVPELQGDVWDDVTIGALAGHTAGLGKFGYVGDLSAIPTFSPDLLGIPHVNGTPPSCDLYPGGRRCTRDEAIAMFNAPVELPRSPNSGPLYSNLGFNLLGMALERVHGSTYEDIIQRLIIEPLDLSDTSFEMPNTTDNALLPGPGEEHWLVGDYGNFNPTGGLWSTPKDIMTFMRAILDNRLLSAADTRKWLQPQSLTSSIHQLVGAPWELYRPDNHETAFKRPIDIFTKAGGVTGYGAYAVVVPEYDLILTINAAGNSSEAAARTLLPSMMQKLIPWADQIARAEAEAHYAGRYSLRNDSSVTVALDEGPGLALSEWNMNGVDVLQSVSGLLGGGVPFSARIYPTDPDSQETNKQFWRIHLSGPEIETDWADYGCSTWTELDRFRYIQQQIDAVYFVVDGGEVRAIEFPGWRMSLKRDA